MTTMDDLILVQRDGGIVTLTINRPEKRNAVGPEALGKLGDILTGLSGDDETRVVILRGSGQKAFSSGFDLDKMNDKDISAPARVRGDARFYGANSLRDFPCPVIAMIYGFCVGFDIWLGRGADVDAPFGGGGLFNGGYVQVFFIRARVVPRRGNHGRTGGMLECVVIKHACKGATLRGIHVF